MTQQQINYRRITKAIEFIKYNFKQQPSLDEIAEQVNLSPYHFQRLFSEWAGISPKKFIQYISVKYAKQLLNDGQSTLLDATHEIGLSGTGRLHDLFVNIEGMTPGEFKNGGERLAINYCYCDSPFGKLAVASTSKGVCQMIFEDDEQHALINLKQRYPNADYSENTDKFQQDAIAIFHRDWKNLKQIKLHLNGTPFQLKVWESLMKIPKGKLRSYGSIAKDIGQPKASRAVGTAVGNNPVAFLIPCHRVIQATGYIGGYRWGSSRKTAMIGWEAADNGKV